MAIYEGIYSHEEFAPFYHCSVFLSDSVFCFGKDRKKYFVLEPKEKFDDIVNYLKSEWFKYNYFFVELSDEEVKNIKFLLNEKKNILRNKILENIKEKIVQKL